MLLTRTLDKHPQREPHPWGEDRTWCTRCGAAAWVDDLAFHVHHYDDDSDAGAYCERPVPPLQRVRNLLRTLSRRR